MRSFPDTKHFSNITTQHLWLKHDSEILCPCTMQIKQSIPLEVMDSF